MPASRTTDPDGLKETRLQQGLVYGPVRSRRFGLSLGVNPFPSELKVCSFNCAYCQYSWTPREGRDAAGVPDLPRAREVREALEQALEGHRAAGTPLESITLAGNGEPCIHPEFRTIAEGLRALRDRFYPDARTAVLSNGSEAHRPEVARTLALFDVRCLKMDGGTDGQLRALNGPLSDYSLERAVEALRAIGELTVQSMFVRGRLDTTAGPVVEAYVDRLRRARPAAVQIYSLDRRPADPRLEKAPPEALERIAARVREEVRADVEVFR